MYKTPHTTHHIVKEKLSVGFRPASIFQITTEFDARRALAVRAARASVKEYDRRASQIEVIKPSAVAADCGSSVKSHTARLTEGALTTVI